MRSTCTSGFGFSAGLFDYVINYSQSTRPWMLLPVGLGYFALYFLLFRFFILRFDLKTLGRELDEAEVTGAAITGRAAADDWIRALGGAENLRAVEACTTRLRLQVGDLTRIDENALKRLGVRGVLKMAEGAVQVVIGPLADQVASEIRARLRGGNGTATPDAALLARVLAALGGRGNIADLRLRASRLCISVHDPGAVDAPTLTDSVRALARPAPGSIHLVIGPAASAWFAQLKSL